MRSDNHLALWAALTAFFGNLVAINVVALVSDEDPPIYGLAAAVATGLIVAAAVYSKQRWDDEKKARAEREGTDGSA